MYRAAKRHQGRGQPRRVSLDERLDIGLFAQYLYSLEWRHLARHESVALQRLAALSLGEKGAGAEVRPGVNLAVGDNEAVAFFDSVDNLRDSAVVARQVA